MNFLYALYNVHDIQRFTKKDFFFKRENVGTRIVFENFDFHTSPSTFLFSVTCSELHPGAYREIIRQ